MCCGKESYNISALSEGGKALGDVNSDCHGNLAGVDRNSGSVLANVRVFVVCWGSYYTDHPDGLEYARKLCEDLVTGNYFNQLSQYGIGRGSIAGSKVIDDKVPPAKFSEDHLRDKLKSWIGPQLIAPGVDESSLLYLVFPPPQSVPTITSGKDGFCGYHQHAKFNNDSRGDDLFWGMARTDKSDTTTGRGLIEAISYCVSHEIAEAVTNPGGGGYFKGDCEIGDLCEQNGTFQYRSWQVEQYWSQLDSACIQGDSPVSVKRFLAAAGKSSASLGALGTSVLNVEYIASQFR
jgi:hypothetical protein